MDIPRAFRPFGHARVMRFHLGGSVEELAGIVHQASHTEGTLAARGSRCLAALTSIKMLDGMWRHDLRIQSIGGCGGSSWTT